jgi:hypothetical protein
MYPTPLLSTRRAVAVSVIVATAATAAELVTAAKLFDALKVPIDDAATTVTVIVVDAVPFETPAELISVS